MTAPDIRRFEVPVDGHAIGGATNAYLVDDVLVDPGARTATLDAAVQTHEPNHVAVTHTHPDHVGGITAYAEATGATVWAHADQVDRFRSATGREPDETFREGDAIGNAGVTVWETPGHAPDHVAFLAGRSALVGDLAVAEGSISVAAPDGDVAAYLGSLARLREEGFDALYPGHGRPITDPASALDRLIDHRLDRERAVVEAIENDASDLTEICERVYNAETLSAYGDLVRATVSAHLEKLLDEERIDGAWSERL